MSKLFPLLLFLSITIFLVFPKTSHAQSFFFQEEFNEERANNVLDNSKWIVYPNAPTGFPTVRETGGNLVTSQQDFRTQYPLIVSKDKVLPDGDFSAEIKFQYTNVTFWGTGIALAQEQPTNGGGFSSLLTIGAWQDKTLSNMRIGFNGVDIYTTPVNTDSHVLKVDRVGKKYLLFLDGTLIFTSHDITKQVKYIWMGNPTIQPPIPAWTSFKVDYIRVIQNFPEPFLDLPWDYQGTGLSFNEAALTINSFFDHEYPLLSAPSLSEPIPAQNNITSFRGEFRVNFDYSRHDGYDYGKKAKANNGDPVLAAGSGVATYMNSCGACGNAILIDHGNGYQTRYYHLQKDGLITNIPGQKVNVNTGEQIGKVGATGNVFPASEAGAHIHFMIIQDKDDNGDFEDNIPDGVTDPFGWQSSQPDPWPLFNFNYLGQQRSGNTSFYLWKKKLDHLDATLTSNGGVFNTGRYQLNFPQGSTNQNLDIEIASSPASKITDNLVSIGSGIVANARDGLGNIVEQFNALFSITVNFSQFDLSRFKPETISFYSSQDGVNWTKEQTSVDLASKTATAQVNHLTHFALMAERADTVPPTTIAALTGEQGQANWFRSDVQISLNARDNPGGLGVDYTLYKVNDGDWQTYTTPLAFTNEGHYKIEFYSVDDDENIEEVKSVEFDIDKTLPEAKVFIDQNHPDLTIEGIDINQTTISKEDGKKKYEITYTITDLAGNSLKVAGKKVAKKNSASLKIYWLQYNQAQLTDLTENLFEVNYQDKKNNLTLEEQNFEVKKKVKINIKYDRQKNQSSITNQKIKEVKEGLVLLQLTTNQGNLEYSY